MSFAGFVSKLGAGMIGGGTAILAPLLAVFASTVDHLDALDEAATRLGTTPEVFDALSKSAKMAGVEAETLESSVARMQAVLSDAAGGGKESAEALAALGLNAKELIALPLDDQLAAIADGLGKIENAADKTAAVRKIFGKGGGALLPLLAGGGEGLKAGMADFRDPGLNDAAKNAGRLNDAIDKVKFAVASAAGSIVFGFLDMVGPIEVVATAITKAANSARDFIRENSAIVVGIAAMAAALVAGGVAFIALGGTLALAATAVGGFGAALVAVKTIALAIASPIGIVTAAALALGAGLAYLWSTTEDGQGAIAHLKDGLKELVGTFSGAFQGIRDAFAAGDLALAGRIAFTALNLEFTKLLGWWTDRWNGFKRFFVDGWHNAIMLVKLAWTDLDEWFSNLFLGIVKGLNEAFGKGISDVLGRLLETLNALPFAVRKTLGLNDLARDLELFKDAFGEKGFSDELERQKKLNKLEHDRQRKRIHDEAQAAQEARDKARAEDKQALDEKIRRLQRELEKLELDASLDASLKRIQDELNAPNGGRAEANQMAASSAAGRGGFGGPLAAQFGVADAGIAKKTLDATERVADGVDELPDRLANVFRMGG